MFLFGMANSHMGSAEKKNIIDNKLKKKHYTVKAITVSVGSQQGMEKKQIFSLSLGLTFDEGIP